MALMATAVAAAAAPKQRKVLIFRIREEKRISIFNQRRLFI